MSTPPGKILILGDGIEAWMTAAFFGKLFLKSGTKITVVTNHEAPEKGAGICSVQPDFINFLNFIGQNENLFMKKSSATFKLADFYSGWNSDSSSFFHSFDSYGTGKDAATFHQAYLLLLQNGIDLPPFDRFSFCAEAAKSNLFSHPENDKSILSSIKYAWHFNTHEFCQLLVEYCQSININILRGKIKSIERDDEKSYANSILLEDQDAGAERILQANLYINCLDSSLSKKLLFTVADNVVHWQPEIFTNLVVRCFQRGKLRNNLCDVITARPYGYENLRPGPEHIETTLYSSTDTLTPDDMGHFLKLHNNPHFETSSLDPFRLKKFWEENTISIGRSSVCLPTHSFSNADLTWCALKHFIKFVPTSGTNPELCAEYNRLLGLNYDSIKDFVRLQFLTSNDKGKYWRASKSAHMSEDLQYKIDLYKRRGRLPEPEGEIFSMDYQMAFLIGTNFLPQVVDPLVLTIPQNELIQHLSKIQSRIIEGLARLSNHEKYLSQYTGNQIQIRSKKCVSAISKKC